MFDYCWLKLNLKNADLIPHLEHWITKISSKDLFQSIHTSMTVNKLYKGHFLPTDPPVDSWQNSYMPSNTGQSSPTLTVIYRLIVYITHGLYKAKCTVQHGLIITVLLYWKAMQVLQNLLYFFFRNVAADENSNIYMYFAL
jgi:hypothetical protein